MQKEERARAERKNGGGGIANKVTSERWVGDVEWRAEKEKRKRTKQSRRI
jgi:hypothetical protein